MGMTAKAAFAMLPFVALLCVLWLAFEVNLPAVWTLSWVPALGVSLDFRVDGLSLLMLLMITGVGTAVFVYAGGYLEGHPQQRRLFVLLTLFMIAMIGCVTADNLIVLFLFWEMTSLISFLLVGFNHEEPGSRKSAQQALLVTGTGGLALLAGFIVLGQAMDTLSVSTIVARLPDLEPTPALTTALVLILVGAFTKSAQFPFHFWLPNAMSAPTPVSAYLHSATMVKLGVYLLAGWTPGLASGRSGNGR
jgi:multicomponent Na+:H+ antiporter subunit A